MRLLSPPWFCYSRKEQTSWLFPPGAAGWCPGRLWPHSHSGIKVTSMFWISPETPAPCTTNYISLFDLWNMFPFCPREVERKSYLRLKGWPLGSASGPNSGVDVSSQLALLACLLPSDKRPRAIEMAQRVKPLGDPSWWPKFQYLTSHLKKVKSKNKI